MKQHLIVGLIAVSITIIASEALAQHRIQGRTVEYTVQDTVMKSFLAYGENTSGRRPAVLVVPEWWGVNDYARKRARMLAGLGYVALAVDMYGEGKVAENPEEAKKLSGQAMQNFEVSRSRFTAATEFLKRQSMVDPASLAAIGYCFGGGIVLNMARQGADLKGVASFHGDLTALRPGRPGEIKAIILVLTGADDPLVPLVKVVGFIEELKLANAVFTTVVYSGATHGFTNPDATALGKRFKMPLAYNARADSESWMELEEFLKEVLRQ